jgi:hypothetical protein
MRGFLGAHRRLVLLADYGIEKPSSFLVLSVEDHGIMELQLFFTPAS